MPDGYRGGRDDVRPRQPAWRTRDGDPKRGEKLFEDCRACHAVDARSRTKWGPVSTASSGDARASCDDFRYSPALKRSGITWTPQTLDAFIADPQKMPCRANRMPYAGMPEARDRADLLTYMEQVFTVAAGPLR